MDKQQQIDLITTISDSIRDQLINHVKEKKIPEDWNGIELRNLLKYRHDLSATMGKDIFKGSRKKSFNNHVLVNYL